MADMIARGLALSIKNECTYTAGENIEITDNVISCIKPNELPEPPSENGNYYLKLNVSTSSETGDKQYTYSWEIDE